MRIVITLFLVFIYNLQVLANPIDIHTINMDSPIPLDNTIHTGVLKNGLTYYIKKNTMPEKRMELRLVIKAGAMNEDADQNGLAHFVEHMLFNGTTHFPKNKLIHDLEKIGVRFGADLNAYTSEDHTVYQLPIATDKPELIHLGLQILADWAGRAIFDPKEIDKERGVILEEWRSNQGVEMRANKIHRQFFYYGSKLATHDVIGTDAVIQHAPYAAISRFYKDWYRPDLMAVIAVGDFDVAAIEKLIQTQFAYLKMPDKPRQLIGNDIDIQANKTPLISTYTDNEQTSTTATILYKKPAGNQITFRYFHNNFIHNMIASMMNERIEALLEKTDSPLQIGGINYGLLFRHTDMVNLFMIPKTEHFMAGYKMFLSEVFRAAQTGFTQGEYTRAKATLLNHLEAEYHNRDKSNSAQFADEYIRHFVHNESLPGIENEYRYVEQLAKTTSLQSINNTLKNDITDDNIVMAITAVKKAYNQLPEKTELLKTYQTLKNSHYSAFKDEFTHKRLFDKQLTPGTLVKTSEIKALGLHEFILSNGIKVIVKTTPFNEKEILLHAFSQGGSSLVPIKDYLNAEYAANIISASGIADFDQLTLNKLLAGKNVTLTPYIKPLTEGINGESTPKDIETLFELLHLYFTAPRKDKKAFAAFISHQKQWVEDFKRNPESEFYEVSHYIMSGNDPRNKPITQQMIAHLNLDAAYKIYQQRFADPSDFTFVFVGNIDLEKFKGLLIKYVASLPTQGTKESFKNVFRDSPKQAIARNFYHGKENKAQVKLILNGKFTYNPQTIYVAEALTSILNYRLTNEIREEKSAVYSINADFLPIHYPNPEYEFEINFEADPRKVNALITSIKAILQDLAIHLPTAEELQKVKQADQRQYEVNLKQNQYWHNKIVMAYFHKTDVNAILHYPEFIKHLTAIDIKTAAHTYFNSAGLKQFVLYPHKKSYMAK